MFDDKWIDKEENSKVMDFIFKWLRPVRSLFLSGDYESHGMSR